MSENKRPTENLETVPDDLDDATHQALDNRVVEEAEFGEIAEELNLKTCRHLLFIIAEESDGLLPSKFMWTRKLLDDNPQLVDMLKVAWQKQSFKSIRNLAILRPQSLTRYSGSLPNVQALEKAVAGAWRGVFSGNHHRYLLHTLNEMWYRKRHQPYSNTVAIIQSSGSGKSRMVHEQAKLVFTLPFNLRKSSDNNGLAYPLPDDRVRNYLTKDTSSFTTTRLRFVLFFKCLFSVITEELHRKFGDDPIKCPEDVFATEWREHLDSEDNRSRLYEEVVGRCEAGWDTVGMSQDTEAQQSLGDLIKVIEARCYLPTADEKLRIILYFDEAHVLPRVWAMDKEDRLSYDHHQALCSALTSFMDYPVFAVLLSNHASPWLLPPVQPLYSSARARDTRDCFQAPITETPFDCSPSLNIKPGQLTINDISKIEFLVQFGRPLFWSMLDASTDKDAVCSSMIRFARSKLTSSGLLDLGHSPLEHRILTVLLDVLIMLDVNLRLEAGERYQVDTIDSHMRVAYSIPAHRIYLSSGYSSEPILAEAAAYEIRHAQEKNPENNIMAATLLRCFDDGLISLGVRAEAVMRLILIQAYMNAVVKDNPSGPAFLFSKGCRVSTFIKELFPERYAECILDSEPDNVAEDALSIQLSEAFQKSILRFTHFVKAADSSVLSTEALFAAFVRGMAFISATPKEAVDIIVPILLDSNQPLQPSSMTALLIKVKRRAARGAVNHYPIDEAELGLFSTTPDFGDRRPYLTLVAEWTKKRAFSAQPRAQPAESHVPIPLDTPSKLQNPTPQNRQGDQNAHPRYSIRAYGCSNTVYKVISSNENSIYQALLERGDLLLEHVRQDPGSLAAVRSMKPLWYSGAPFNWVDSGIRNEKEEEEEEVEYVEAGCATCDD